MVRMPDRHPEGRVFETQCWPVGGSVVIQQLCRHLDNFVHLTLFASCIPSGQRVHNGWQTKQHEKYQVCTTK